MRAHSGRSFTQENRLTQRQNELSELRARHSAAKTVLQQLLDQIEDFRRLCDQTLACRLAELDEIDAESSRLTRSFKNPRDCHGSSEPAGAFRKRDAAVYDIKTTYRMLAKAIHPDLAEATPSRFNRHELMSRANRAYAEADLRTLRTMLGVCRDEGLVGEDDEDAELVRLEQLICREREELDDLEGKVEAVRQSCAWRLKLRLDGRGCDAALVSDLVAVADETIAKALRRLAVLKGERPLNMRTLHFPYEVVCGIVYLRDRTSINYSQWKVSCLARGAVNVDADKVVRLDVKGASAAKVNLRALKGDDLHSLYLYDATDEDVESILHLTGLEELYLSGESLTDAALLHISSLRSLKRIYIYRTSISDDGLLYLRSLENLTGLTCSGNSITDEGLDRFRRVVPTVRTISFDWRR